MFADIALPSFAPPEGVIDALGAMLAYALAWREKARQRKALADLDERLLRDIGLGRVEAKRESSRWFWSVRARRLECRPETD